MIPNQTLESYPEFANNGTKTAPDDAKYAAGFQQADVLPAEWMNWAWGKNTRLITALNSAAASIEQEINNVLTAAGATASESDNTQLREAIKYLIGVIAAPIAHASTATTYGVGTTTQYGHVKVRNDLTASSYADGEALSAYQGKVLSDAKADKQSITAGTVGTTSDVTPGYGSQFSRPWFTVNAQGLVTSYGTSQVTMPPIENSLTSTSGTTALSAYQGYILNAAIGVIPRVAVAEVINGTYHLGKSYTTFNFSQPSGFKSLIGLEVRRLWPASTWDTGNYGIHYTIVSYSSDSLSITTTCEQDYSLVVNMIYFY